MRRTIVEWVAAEREDIMGGRHTFQDNSREYMYFRLRLSVEYAGRRAVREAISAHLKATNGSRLLLYCSSILIFAVTKDDGFEYSLHNWHQ